MKTHCQNNNGARYGIPLERGQACVTPCAAWFSSAKEAVAYAQSRGDEVWDLVEGRRIWEAAPVARLTCGVCRHWSPCHFGAEIGACKRNPPTVLAQTKDRAETQALPLMAAGDWCGEAVATTAGAPA